METKGKRSGACRINKKPYMENWWCYLCCNQRSYKQKLNKKMYRAGMRSILSELLRQGRLIIKDDIYPSAS